MINNIKIDYKNQSLVLSNLGSINVICGKNNSGKSTILRILGSEGNINYGKNIYKELIEKLLPEDPSFDKYLKLGLSETINKEQLANLKDQLISYNKEDDFIYYENEIEKFKRFLSEIYRNLKYTLPINLFEFIWEDIFQYKLKQIHLQTERDMPFSTSISGGNRVELNNGGRDVLLNLMYWKNQLGESNDLKTFNKIARAFKEITNGTEFSIVFGKHSSSSVELWFENKFLKEPVQANFCGSGMRQLLNILTFAYASNFNIIKIEEPENQLNPELQRRLLAHLSEIKNKQFFISTHSNIFLDNAFIDSVYLTEFVDNSIQIKEITSKTIALSALGYSPVDNILSDLTILCEGPHDITIIDYFLNEMGLHKTYSIKVSHLGGDAMDSVDLTVFGSPTSVMSIIDSDPGSNKTRENFKQKCLDSGVYCHRLKNYAIENYFSIQSYKKIFGNQGNLKNLNTIKSDVKVEKQLNFDPKKRLLNIAKVEGLKGIEGSDLMDFLNKVKSQLKTTLKRESDEE